MKINILTLFPEMFSGFKSESIIRRAIEKGSLEINLIDIREYTKGRHNQADDVPYGGGAGMVLKPEPLLRALADIESKHEEKETFKVIYTSPQGVRFDQELANSLALEGEITIIAGHYEGIDERVVDAKVDMEISIGDFVLTGGELPAMVIADAIARLVPGVIKKESYENDSFYSGLLDHPHYTRPSSYEGLEVPEILLSGHHAKIDEWRLKQSLKRTKERRPDILEGRNFTKLELKLLKEIEEESKKN